MCHSSDAHQALMQAGGFKKLPPAINTLAEAQIKDIKKLYAVCEENDAIHRETAMRISAIEKDVATVKENMVTKKEFAEFKESLTQAVRDAAKFNLMRDIFASPKAWIMFLIFCGALMGARYLDFLVGVSH